LPESDSPIPNIRADFLRFGSKIVEHSLYLPSSETVNLFIPWVWPLLVKLACSDSSTDRSA
jgi:hypothetical protein